MILDNLGGSDMMRGTNAPYLTGGVLMVKAKKKMAKLPAPREFMILSLIWEKGPQTVQEVYRGLDPNQELMYTNFLKTMQMMVAKGYLRRQKEKRVLAHVYEASVEWKEAIVASFEIWFATYADKKTEYLLFCLEKSKMISPAVRKKIRDMG